MEIKSTQTDYQILICLIQIWTPKNPTDLSEQPINPTLIAEVENLEIEESYKELISTAVVSFPRGTVIKKTTTQVNIKDDAISQEKIGAATIDNGVVYVKRTDSKLATVDDFSVGNRIRIMLGYTTDPKIAGLTKISKDKTSIFNDSVKLAEYQKHLTMMFDGFITKCSIDMPVQIQCENIASCLRKISCPHLVIKNNVTVNDLLSENGKYKLLKGTGLKLYPLTEQADINLGPMEIPSDLTIADLFENWSSKAKVHSYIKYGSNGEPYICMGRVYFSNIGKDSVLYGADTDIPVILFDYNVTSNSLTLMKNDKDYLVVEASCLEKNGKFYKMSIRKNPNYDPDVPNSPQWQILNEVKLSKKEQKAGATVMSNARERVDLSKYTIIPYMSNKIGISHDELLEEAIKCFQEYNPNGVQGSLTLFGDFNLRTGTKIKMIDNRNPQKNGYYLVDNVTTKFGVGGYRQTIKTPFLISKLEEDEKR